MPFVLKKLLPLCLVILLCVSCAGCSSPAAKDADQAFSDLCQELSASILSENTLDLHFCLSDPAKLGIQQPAASLGHLSSDAFAAEQNRDQQTLVRLAGIDRALLSEENAYLYDILCTALQNHTALLAFPYLYEPLSSHSGLHVQLPLMLSEYRFADAQDVRDYLDLLQLLPDYFAEITAYETQKAAAGCFMSQSACTSLLEFCHAFPAEPAESHFLSAAFDEKLAALSMDDAEKEALRQQHLDLLTNAVFPAYTVLADAAAALSENTVFHNTGLCSLPNGRDYFALLVKDQTGDSRPMEEIGTQLEQDLPALADALTTALTENPQLWELLLTSDLRQTLQGDAALSAAKNDLACLSKLTEASFGTARCDYTVQFIAPALASRFSSAFFLIPPADDQNNPGIYINPQTAFSPFDLFTTLAHEGFPGHLLQNHVQKGNLISRLFSCTGYAEGWASYCELYTYPLAVETMGLAGDFPVSEVAGVLQTYRKLTLCLYALLDYNIHYNYWTADDAAILLSSYGITDSGTVQQIYDYIVSEPANYMTYYLGYTNVEQLKRSYMAAGHSEDEFHKAFLDCIEAPFAIVEAKLMQAEDTSR